MLSGRHREPLEWSARQKVAVGAARGLRYLHEECRVGCIVHRDMRPNNILITHDFEPLVTTFSQPPTQPFFLSTTRTDAWTHTHIQKSKVHRTTAYRLIWAVHIGPIGDRYG